MDFMAVRLSLLQSFNLQITSGAGPLKLYFSAFDTCLFQHLSCVQMALYLMALTFEIEIVVISLRKLSQGILQNLFIFGEAAAPRIGTVAIHPLP